MQFPYVPLVPFHARTRRNCDGYNLISIGALELLHRDLEIVPLQWTSILLSYVTCMCIRDGSVITYLAIVLTKHIPDRYEAPSG